MHFCSECGNMYYIKISDDTNSLNYYCRKCGNEDKNLINSNSSICVSKTEIKKGSNSYKHIINKYTKFDPTLPRIDNIDCPNDKCPSNVNTEEKSNTEYKCKEIIYLRYDDNNMKYIYLCCNCDNSWTTHQKQ